jgi:nucleotide-binding universal stress UspA family protein
MKILLPIDSTRDAKLMIDFVANYRWLRGTEFKILHVMGTNKDDLAAAEAESKAEALVSSIASKLKLILTGCDVTTEVVLGQPIYEILQAASNWKATMIVMGFRTRPVAHRFLAGSVSRGVAQLAPCSVSIIRPPEDLQTQSDEDLVASNLEWRSA